jgi:hypothetical protein
VTRSTCTSVRDVEIEPQQRDIPATARNVVLISGTSAFRGNDGRSNGTGPSWSNFLSFFEERIPRATAGVNPTILHRPRSDADTDMYVATRHRMTDTEAGSPPPNCTISGRRDPDRSRQPLEPLWCLGQDTSESSLPGRGVPAVWPRHRVVMPTSPHPATIPPQRCGAPGRLAV